MKCVMRLRSAVALGIVLTGAIQGCSSTKECTLIGCGPPFEVAFAPSGGQWLSGTYSVAVTADGSAGSCDVTLPFASMNVEVVVSRDGRQLVDGTFIPSYQSSQPNGPGCGDTCYGAPSATLALQP